MSDSGQLCLRFLFAFTKQFLLLLRQLQSRPKPQVPRLQEWNEPLREAIALPPGAQRRVALLTALCRHVAPPAASRGLTTTRRLQDHMLNNAIGCRKHRAL